MLIFSTSGQFVDRPFQFLAMNCQFAFIAKPVLKIAANKGDEYMLELVDEIEVYKREYVKKVKIKGTVPNNFKWLVNQNKKLKNLVGNI